MIPQKLFNKDFILLFQGQMVSQLGGSLYVVGIIFWLKQSTSSATLMGLIYMVGMIPGVLLGPLGGTVVDRYSRKKIIVFADIIKGGLMLSMAVVMLWMPQATELIIILLFITTFFNGSLAAFFQPAVSATIPDLVPTNRLEGANGLLQSSVQIAFLVGQCFGGLLFVVLGAPVLLLINGISYLLSAFSEAFITIPQKKAIPKENWRATVSSFKTETAEGFHYIRVKPGLLDLFVMQGVTTFFIAPLGVLLPFFVEDTLHSTPKWYGFLMAGLAFGVTLGSVVSAVIKIAPVKKGKLIGSALIFYSLCLIGVGYSQTVVTALLVLMVMGVCSGLMYVLVNSVIQRSTPGEIRGRVFGLLTTATLALTPISMGLAGIVADLVNHNITLIYTGCGICTLIATLMLLLREGLHQLLSGDDYSVNSV